MKNDGSNVEKYSAFSFIKDEGGSMLFCNVGPGPADSSILYGVVVAFW
jgi:hypothetical protein